MNKILPFIDLTSLNKTDTQEDIKKLIDKAKDTDGILKVASICIYPSMIKFVRDKLLGESKVNVATVTGGFPSGKLSLESKLLETKEAIQAGADEIDFTICRDYCVPSGYQKLFDEICAVKKVVGKRVLKVILEVEELYDYEKIRLTSDIALDAGADFIKTSTGKIKGSLDHKIASALIIMESIKNFYNFRKKQAGIKISGGISKVDTAMIFFNMVQTQLGENWVNPKFFRIGSSSLLDNILKQTKI